LSAPRKTRAETNLRPSAHVTLLIKQQHAALVRRINGHCNYFGVNGNSRSLGALLFYARRAWHKWLCRRSQRAYLSWPRFLDLLRDFPLPRPSICLQIWATP
jgi:RNA-directed DNA polymerase